MGLSAPLLSTPHQQLPAAQASRGGMRVRLAPLLVLATTALCLLGSATITSAVTIAKDKSLCEVGNKEGARQKYALYPSGQCAICAFGVAGEGNHCYAFLYGEAQCLLSFNNFYTIINKGKYRQCVCAAGLFGKPVGDNTTAVPPQVAAGPKELAGCNICPFFSSFAPPGTNSQQCGQCSAARLYTGKPPFCQYQPTKFAKDCVVPSTSQDASKDAYYRGSYIPGTKKCGCAAGDFGTWPHCQPCPPGLSSPIGNGNTCTCDKKQGYLPSRPGSKPPSCKCDTSKGYFPAFHNRTSCVQCSKVKGGAVVKANGGARVCGCNVKQGYGVSAVLGASGPCIKCAAQQGAALDKVSGQCRCKAGFGVDPTYGTAGKKQYCIACSGAGLRVNSKGVCSCASGYARNPFDLTKCVRCNSPRQQPVSLPPQHPQPICYCKPAFSLESNGTCTPCSAPYLSSSSSRTFCECADKNADTSTFDCRDCRPGYVRNPTTKRCELGPECRKSTWTLKYWDSAAIGASWDGAQFPDFLISKKVKPTKTLSPPSISVTLPGASLPSLGSRFAVVLEGYFLPKNVAPRLPPTKSGYVPAAGLGAVATNSFLQAPDDSRFFNRGQSAEVFTTAGGAKGRRTELRIVDLGINSPVQRYEDNCRYVKILWWGTKKGATLTVRKVATLGNIR